MIAWTEIVMRLALAALFGAVIGLERERKSWAAGLRTHMLVCVGAALTMIVSAYGFMDVLQLDHIALDPSRIAAQVISGIGFLGAGTILSQRQGVVRGLTTAAGLWTVAAIGLATGAGMYFAGSVTTVLALVILWILQPIEKRFLKRFKKKVLKITTSSNSKSLQVVNDILQNNSLAVSSFSVDKNDADYVLSVLFKNADNKDLVQLINTFQADPDIRDVLWTT